MRCLSSKSQAVRAVCNELPPVALLAGGLATRLRPATDMAPKSLLQVAGKPFLAHQLRLLAQEGARDVVICCGHFGEQIEHFAGDGAEFGCRVRYCFDGDSLLGTGGALRHALPMLGDVFFVMYGDSYLPVNFRAVHERFKALQQPALMTVFRNQGRWNKSNVIFRKGRVVLYEKTLPLAEMEYIDYGLGVLTAACLSSWWENEVFDLGDVYGRLARERRLAGFEATERFYEIGSHAGRAAAEKFLNGVTV